MQGRSHPRIVNPHGRANRRNAGPARALRVALLAIASLAALLAAVQPGAAQTTNWTGATSNDWFTSTNWDNGVPLGTAVIDNPTNNPVTIGAHNPNAVAFGVTVGDAATGSLTVSGGGTLSNSNFLHVGNGATGVGTVTVTGANSFMGNSDGEIGVSGTGTLNLQNGGTANFNDGLTLGLNPGSNGTVNVDGGTLSVTGAQIFIGSGGTGTLTVSNGGSVSLSGDHSFSGSAVRLLNGSVNIGAANNATAAAPGTFNVSNLLMSSGTSLIFNHTSTNYVFGTPKAVPPFASRPARPFSPRPIRIWSRRRSMPAPPCNSATAARLAHSTRTWG